MAPTPEKEPLQLRESALLWSLVTSGEELKRKSRSGLDLSSGFLFKLEFRVVSSAI